MISFQANINYQLLDDIRELNRRLPEQTKRILKSGVSKYARQQVDKYLKNAAPRRPVYPIRWQSERQRRAYFSDGSAIVNPRPGQDSGRGFGRGIPTTRTGDMQRWQVRANYRSRQRYGEIVVTNPSDYVEYYAQYVVGEWQQQFHATSGWWILDEQIALVQRAVYVWALSAFWDLITSELEDL